MTEMTEETRNGNVKLSDPDRVEPPTLNRHKHLLQTGREALPLAMTGAILCGGRSSRMGRSKPFLPYGGSTFVESRYRQMQKLFSEVLIVANEPEEFAQINLEVVKDILPHRGPLVGILSALLVASYDHVFVIACDMPLVKPKTMREMCQRRQDADVVVAEHECGIEPLLGVYARSLVAALEESIFADKLKAVDFLDGVNSSRYRLKASSAGLPAYFNVNTPSDYSRVLTGDR